MVDEQNEFSRILTCGKFSGRVHKAYDHSEWIKMICSPGSLWSHPDMRLLVEGRNRVGVISFADGKEEKSMVAKEFRAGGIDRLKARFQPSKAQKAWRGSCFLQEKGIPTPPPAAFLEPQKNHSGENGYFFCEFIPDAVEIRGLFLEPSGIDIKVLLKHLAAFVYACHEKGVLHRDLSDGNVLVSKKKNGEYGFSLLDTNRIKERKRIRFLSRAKNLIRLGVPAAYQRFFIQSYPGYSPSLFWGWYRVNKSVFSWYIKTKKKLKLKKLARALRL